MIKVALSLDHLPDLVYDGSVQWKQMDSFNCGIASMLYVIYTSCPNTSKSKFWGQSAYDSLCTGFRPGLATLFGIMQWQATVSLWNKLELWTL